MDCIIWIAALTSFSDQAIDISYWMDTLETEYSAYSFNAGTSYTIPWMTYSYQPYGYYSYIEFSVNINSFLSATNNFNLDTIATSLQSSVSSKIYYSILGGTYFDTSNKFVIINDTSMLYLGTSGSPQTQTWEATALCRPYMFAECWFTSNNESDIVVSSNNSWDYEAEWSSLLPNTYSMTINNYHYSSQQRNISTYQQPTRVSAIYGNMTDYQTDYQLNGEFTLNSVRESWYNNYPTLNANADLVDVHCLAVFTACNDTNICSIQLPWCYNYPYPPATTMTTTTTTTTTTPTTTEPTNIMTNTIATTATATATTSSTTTMTATEVSSGPSSTMSTCSLPPKQGRCKPLRDRYYHNPENDQCETFSWGGCGGNDNNFKTFDECKAVCNPTNIYSTDNNPNQSNMHKSFESLVYISLFVWRLVRCC